MENLFQSNLSTKHVKAQGNLRANIEFCQKLVSDLESTFNVVVENKRRDEFEHETIVYPLCQARRYGYGFTFTATNEGVTFTDGRGLWLECMAKVLGAKITDKYEDLAKNWISLGKAAKRIGAEVEREGCSGSGDHFSLKMKLSKNDKKLNAKLKAIMGTMMGQNVTTKL